MKSFSSQSRAGGVLSTKFTNIITAVSCVVIFLIFWEFRLLFTTQAEVTQVGEVSHASSYKKIENAALRCCPVHSGQNRARTDSLEKCAKLCDDHAECNSFDYSNGTLLFFNHFEY